jgi:hypothetical protein
MLPAGKDKFCRVCGRGAENWLRWTAEEKVGHIEPALREWVHP